MKKAMMKKLIFCLLVLTGAGMLNSCQQDEVVNEAPASKEIVIRASLPGDAQSRVTLGETDEDSDLTPVLWQAGDKITMIPEGSTTEYYFVTQNNNTAIADFTYDSNSLGTDDLPAIPNGGSLACILPMVINL